MIASCPKKKMSLLATGWQLPRGPGHVYFIYFFSGISISPQSVVVHTFKSVRVDFGCFRAQVCHMLSLRCREVISECSVTVCVCVSVCVSVCEVK